ncbi:MAG TPA: hypothetical protein VGR35_23100 [Tepidisphaeraceae bacterium]|nr:hypothetical protein [Tepidisphaeraceae bacterium]
MPAGLINGRRAIKHRPSRRRNPAANRPNPTTPIQVTGVTVLGEVATVTFDQPVSLKGTPAYTTDVVGATASSAEQTGVATIAITFNATIAAATEIRIPYEEPAVRNASGGFVSTSTFPV